jgi:hypothetical protein
MTEPLPPLPANRAFVVQFRAQGHNEPLSWEGRVEHCVSGQNTLFESCYDMCRFITRVLGDLQVHQENVER